MMNGNWQKDYPLLPESLKESDIENNSSLKKMINFIGGNKKVLDVGCATGYLARLLREKGCSVIGIEINQKAAEIARSFCEEVIAVDLERVSLAEILSDRLFDVVVFGDILEHLRDPWRILQETHQVLAPSGYVVASIPNIAHGNIRLSLLQGNFDYQEVGILDNTHLRFFTRKTLEELFFDTGYSIEATERTQMPFEKSYSHDASLVEKLEKEPDIDTLQFIVRAFPSSLENQHNLLRENYRQSIDRLERTREELESTRSELESTRSELESTRSQLEKTREESGSISLQLEQTREELRLIGRRWKQSQFDLEQAQQGWGRAHNIIEAIESSKFWKLRQLWFRVKLALGLNVK
jgi:2-polyprenyl-3-methyl-5-hydroxy-6-metoxy-1,4-benzoquinol methylase